MSPGRSMHCSRANRIRNCAISSFAAGIRAPVRVSSITGMGDFSSVSSAEVAPSLRAVVCALLRDGTPAEFLPDEIETAARAEGLHLVLADRLRVPTFA